MDNSPSAPVERLISAARPSAFALILLESSVTVELKLMSRALPSPEIFRTFPSYTKLPPAKLNVPSFNFTILPTVLSSENSVAPVVRVFFVPS